MQVPSWFLGAVACRRRTLPRVVLVIVAVAVMLAARDASAVLQQFDPGTLIIPTDTGTAGQDNGMLRAYGLVYALLRSGVAVSWVIDPAKTANGNDFVINAANALQDVRTGATLAARSYRGGPFLVAAADAATALPVIQNWQAAAGDQTAVHRLVAASPISVPVARRLVGAPRIAVLKDGNETIAFNDLNAAAIADPLGAVWTSASAGLLTETDVAGPTTTDHADGALFQQPSGLPRYCAFLSMHYDATAQTSEVVQEVRAWLGTSDRVHAFMQCQASVTFEDDANGHYLTSAGIVDDGAATTNPALRVPADPLAQMDGSFTVDTGAVDSIGPSGTPSYQTGVTTLINDAATVLTSGIVLLEGRLDGDPTNGQVTYLAGHDYATDLPVTSNPKTNGVRLFLNAILASDCATTLLSDDLTITNAAPAFTNTSLIPYTITLGNPVTNAVAAENIVVTDKLPAGTTYVSGSATPTPTSISGGTIKWSLPDLAPGAHTTVTFQLSATADGTYTNNASVASSTDLVRTVAAAAAVTVRDTVPPTVSITAGPTGLTTATPSFKFTMSNDAVSAVCAIDNVNFTGCSPDPAQYTSASLTAGLHTFAVRVADAAGNTATASRSFTVDTSPPVVTFADPPTNQTVTANATPRFYFTAMDDNGPVTTFCSVAGDPFVPCTSPFTTRPLPDGPYTVSAYGQDGAGNTGPTDNFSFTIDHQPPVVSIPVPPNQTIVATKTPTFTFADVGAPGTAVTFVCHVDSGADAPCASPYTVPAPTNLSDGAHTLTVTATDQAGNGGQASLGFTVDTVAPLVTIPGLPTNPTNVASATPTLFFQVSNAPSTTPIVSSVCRVYDAAPPNTLRASSPAQSLCDTLFTVPMSSALSDGDYLFEVTATDAAGNVGQATHSFSFTVDTAAPVVTIIVPPSPTETSNRTPTFTFSVEPGGTSVTTSCRAYVPFSAPPSAVPCSSPYTLPSPLADGAYIFEVIARDAAGDTGSAYLLFHVDNAPPDISITGTPPNPTNNATPQFTFTITDTSSTTPQCAVDTGAFADCLSPFTVVPGVLDGDHVLHVRVTDASGNVAEASAPFTVDTTPPDVRISPAAPTITTSSHPALPFTVTDAHPGETDCIISRISGPPSVALNLNCASPFVPTLTVDGNYELEIVSTDAAGNVGHDILDFTVDRMPPDTSITRLGPTPSAAQVDFILTANEPATFECDIDDAGFVPCPPQFTTAVLADGDHVLVARAIDAAGNVDPTPAVEAWQVGTTAAPGASLCAGGPFTCKAPGLTRLTIRNDADDARDTLQFSWTRGDPTSVPELGDPTVDTAYEVCVWDDVAGTPTLVMDMLAPPAGNCIGRPCWRVTSRGTLLRYNDPGRLPDGLQNVTVKAGPLGRSRIFVKAGGLTLPDPPMPFRQDPHITVQVVNSIGSCWGVDYATPARPNTPKKLVAKERP